MQQPEKPGFEKTKVGPAQGHLFHASRLQNAAKGAPSRAPAPFPTGTRKHGGGSPGQGPEENTEPEARAKESSYEGERDCVGKDKEAEAEEDTGATDVRPRPRDAQVASRTVGPQAGEPQGWPAAVTSWEGGLEHTAPELLASVVSGH